MRPASFTTALRRASCPSLHALRTAVRAASGAAAATTPASFYRRLRVESDATPAELKTAYRRRALECHPDVVDAADRPRAEVEFRAVSEAYDVLADPTRRAEHDRALGLAAAQPAKQQKPTKEEPRDEERRRHAPRRPGHRRPFVRGDAERMFRDAFDGLSLDEVLFRAQKMQKQRKREKSDGGDDSPLGGRDEALRQATTAAAERFASRVRRQYGPAALRHVKLRSASPAAVGNAPPAQRMPFRPFIGWAVPAGVETPPTPTPGRPTHVDDERVEAVAPLVSKAEDSLPRHFPRVRGGDGGALPHEEAVRHLEKVRHGPHNMGKLYSYHRPY